MNQAAVRNLQAQLGLPQTGTLDAATVSAMEGAVARSVAANRDIARYAGTTDPATIASAYMTGDWSGVTDLTGKPFTKAQQQGAVSEAERVLAPAYRAAESFDRDVAESSLRDEGAAMGEFQKAEARDFRDSKNQLDQSAADQGVLFAGSRIQAQNDLRSTYQDREAQARRQSEERVRSTARGFQYEYGDDAASGLSGMYRQPGASQFNAGVAGGKVTPGALSSAYDPGQFRFQGTKPVAQKAAVQTRAAGQLANRANKLSLSGYGTKF